MRVWAEPGTHFNMKKEVTMDVKKIVVAGGGTMGHGIALTWAVNGYKVIIVDVSHDALVSARKLVNAAAETLLEAEFISKDQAGSLEDNLSYTTDLSVASDADMTVEAIPEKPELKAQLFARLDQIVRPDCILTSTTSSMNIYQFVKVSHPERLLIVHWCNPPHILPLVEIVKGAETDQSVVDYVKELLVGIGKRPAVINQPVPGFIINRLNLALMREASFMVEQGWVSAEDIDTAFSCNQGMKAPFEGPLQMMDFIGWDIGCMAGKFIYPSISNATEPGPLAKQMLSEGRLGLKSGKGIYDYSYAPREEIQKERDAYVLEVVKVANKFKR